LDFGPALNGTCDSYIIDDETAQYNYNRFVKELQKSSIVGEGENGKEESKKDL
jgi:hypothetical protein